VPAPASRPATSFQIAVFRINGPISWRRRTRFSCASQARSCSISAERLGSVGAGPACGRSDSGQVSTGAQYREGIGAAPSRVAPTAHTPRIGRRPSPRRRDRTCPGIQRHRPSKVIQPHRPPTARSARIAIRPHRPSRSGQMPAIKADQRRERIALRRDQAARRSRGMPASAALA